MGAPNLRNQVINIIPGDSAICHASPPAQEVCREDVAVRVEVVCDGDLVVLPRRGDEPNAEGLACAAQL